MAVALDDDDYDDDNSICKALGIETTKGITHTHIHTNQYEHM
jgi:hypothetical protein